MDEYKVVINVSKTETEEQARRTIEKSKSNLRRMNIYIEIIIIISRSADPEKIIVSW